MKSPVNYPYNLLKEIGRLRSSEWFENIYDAECHILHDADIVLPADFAGSLEYVLYTLSDREREIICCRYKEGLTLEETGKRFDLTRERIRQIEAKALRKLKHPTRQQYLQKGVIGLMEELSEAKALKLIESEKAKIYLEGFDACRKELEDKLNSTNENSDSSASAVHLIVASDPIEVLDLSVRSYNALKRAKVDTIGQIAGLSVNRLKRIRNIGASSVCEILKKMNLAGYKLSDFGENEV